MTFAPRFSPDGQRVIMSLQQGGNANLFVMDLRSKQTTRLTDTPAIDSALLFAGWHAHLLRERSRRFSRSTSCWPPAGRRSASASARATIRRRSGRHAATTLPSPARREGILPSACYRRLGERMLTEGFHNEGPTFAPNGRVLMFFRDGSGPGALHDRYLRSQ